MVRLSLTSSTPVADLLSLLLKYEFTALLFLYFSWEDPTAMDKMITVSALAVTLRSSARSSASPDRSGDKTRIPPLTLSHLLLPLTLSLLLSQSTNAYRNGSGDCQFPCVAGSMPSRTAEGYAPEFSCCDDIWLPQVVAYNLIPPYHTQFSGLIVGEDGKVGWYKSLYGKYFTNMQFSLFPLDTQRLQISLGLTSVSHGAGSQTVRFVPSATASMFLMRNAIEGQKKKADSVSGWSIQDVSMQVVDQPLEEAVDYFIEYFGTPPVPEEPMPVAGDNDTNRDPSNPFRDPEFRHHGVNIYISIKVRWVHNISAFRSSHPSMVLTLSPLAGISFVSQEAL